MRRCTVTFRTDAEIYLKNIFENKCKINVHHAMLSAFFAWKKLFLCSVYIVTHLKRTNSRMEKIKINILNKNPTRFSCLEISVQKTLTFFN